MMERLRQPDGRTRMRGAVIAIRLRLQPSVRGCGNGASTVSSCTSRACARKTTCRDCCSPAVSAQERAGYDRVLEGLVRDTFCSRLCTDGMDDGA